jgi:hypothetical protein
MDQTRRFGFVMTESWRFHGRRNVSISLFRYLGVESIMRIAAFMHSLLTGPMVAWRFRRNAYDLQDAAN